MNIDQIKSASLQLLDVFLQNPASDVERWGVGIAALLVGAWVFLKVGDKLDLPNVGLVSAFVFTGVGIAACIVGLVLGKHFLPDLYRQFGDMYFYIATGLLLSLAVIVPIMNAVIQGKYLGTLAAWAIAVAAVWGIVLMATAGIDAVKGGGRVFDRGRAHNDATKQFLR